MAIILEGFDGSGKSTLAASFGLEIVHPGPRPKTDTEVQQCLEHQLKICGDPIVMDRVTAISQPCYSEQFSLKYHDYVMRMANTPHCIIVYCRPPTEVIKDFSNHVIKDYDDEAKVRWLKENADRIIKQYDHYFSMIPHFKYDYTRPNQAILDMALQAQTNWWAWNYARNHLL